MPCLTPVASSSSGSSPATIDLMNQVNRFQNNTSTPALDARLNALTDKTSLDSGIVYDEQSLLSRLNALKSNDPSLDVTKEINEVTKLSNTGLTTPVTFKKKQAIHQMEQTSQKIGIIERNQERRRQQALMSQLPFVSPQSDLYGLDSSSFHMPYSPPSPVTSVKAKKQATTPQSWFVHQSWDSLIC
jgi:hypothetical protein